MQDDQTEAFSLRAAYKFANENGLQQEAEDIRNMSVDWTVKRKSSVRRGYMIELFTERGLLETFKDHHWAYGRTSHGERMIRGYVRLKQRFDDFLAGKGDDNEGDDELGNSDGGDEGEQQFALESDLRDYLANNLHIIEPGLRTAQLDGRAGVEYAITGGRIDILAIDRIGKYVVVELKVSRGRNRTVGQLLYYMGWVDEHLGSGPCRGIIVASEISGDLLLAVRRAPGVLLYRYRLSVTVEPVIG